MAIKEIYTTTDKENFLRQKCQDADISSDDTKALISDLFDTLSGGDSLGRIGVGLAAPQIGVPLRVAVVSYSGDKDENGDLVNSLPKTVLINPKIVKYSKEKELFDEGCFSIPELYGPVERPKKIRVETFELNGKKKIINASGYYARVIQHEIDHLDGVLYTDYVAKDKLYKHTPINTNKDDIPIE